MAATYITSMAVTAKMTEAREENKTARKEKSAQRRRIFALIAIAITLAIAGLWELRLEIHLKFKGVSEKKNLCLISEVTGPFLGEGLNKTEAQWVAHRESFQASE